MEGLKIELLDATLDGDVDEVVSLIERGVDIDSRYFYGETALLKACMLRDTSIAIASLLIERGADVKSGDNDGETALHKACFNGHTATASLLIERGSKVDSRDNNGRIVLYWACNYGYKEIAILLIRSKADIYIQNNDGRAPLDLQPEWRVELTQLYEEVNRDWLARKSSCLC